MTAVTARSGGRRSPEGHTPAPPEAKSGPQERLGFRWLCDLGQGPSVLYPNEVTMTAFCRAAAGLWEGAWEAWPRAQPPSPPSPVFSPRPGAWAWVSPRRTKNAHGETQAGRQAIGSLPLTRGPPFVPTRKTQLLEVILTCGGGESRPHHDSQTTVSLQRPRLERKLERRACVRSHWVPWV